MNGNRTIIIVGVGCVLLILLLIAAIPLGFLAFTNVTRTTSGTGAVATAVVEAVPVPSTPEAESRRTERVEPPGALPEQPLPGVERDDLTTLYQAVNPGVVNIRVEVTRGLLSGEGAGSGFILDNEGHIVTNSHVVAGADSVLVVYYNGIEAEAEVIGSDADSDLAVVKVDELIEGTHPLPLGDSDLVKAGQWVVAVGNPFELGGSMTVGIVSAVGRLIPSLAEDFSIPQAIQTDAAINPGNSGGPLLNLQGEVIGVNAQIQSGGIRANAGVGFAVPSNIVKRVVPVLIEEGSYQWPWLGVRGGDVNLSIMRANNLDSQQGAYIVEALPNGPAAEAGLQGLPDQNSIAGGDVVIAADGKSIADFSDLLNEVMFRKPGDTMELTILRDGQRQQVTVTLEARPADLGP